ncbi:hypothetical protein ACFXPW_21570 [Streptomyces goshikiensis]
MALRTPIRLGLGLGFRSTALTLTAAVRSVVVERSGDPVIR